MTLARVALGVLRVAENIGQPLDRRPAVGYRLALKELRPEFSATLWKAFEEHALAGRPAGKVAAELQVATGTVYVAKSRVVKRLREELAGLLD
jgi:RNA polymerase sigma-70 factor (ECF subfamily)